RMPARESDVGRALHFDCCDSRARRNEPTPGGPMDPMMPPPVRRIALDRDPFIASPKPIANGAAPTAVAARPRAVRAPAPIVRERMAVESLWLAYGENWVVRDVSLPVRQGEVLAMIGASGSGKTTLLRSLNRLTEDIHELEVNTLRRRVTMVFQQPNPFPMSIFDNVAYALAERPGRGGTRRRRSAKIESAVNDALQRAGLYDEVASDLDRSALRLSGGHQQRLC